MCLKLNKQLRLFVLSSFVTFTSMATAMNLPTGGDIQGTYDVTSDYVGGHDPDNQLVIIDDTVIQSQGSGVCLTLGGSEGVYTNFAPLTSPNPDSSLLIQNFKTIVLSYTRYETEDLQHHGAVEYLVYKNNGDMYFHHNETNSTGAALNAFNSVYLSSNKNIFFYENLCGAAGAAIYSQKDVVLEGNENIYFVNNTAKLSGGAMYVVESLFIGNNENVVFAGNTLEDGTRQAIYQQFDFVDNYISANAGKSVTFYDGMEIHGNMNLNTNIEGSVEGFGSYTTNNPSGTIEFSGGGVNIPGIGYIAGAGQNAISDFKGDLVLGGGTMKISQGAKVNVVGNMQMISGSTLCFDLTNTQPDQSCALTVGSMTLDDDKNITISSVGSVQRGQTYNLIHYINPEGVSLSDYTLMNPEHTQYHWNPETGILSLSVDNYLTNPEKAMKGNSLWGTTLEMRALMSTVEQRYADSRFMCLNPEYKTIFWSKYIGNYQKLNSGSNGIGSTYSSSGFAIGGDTQIASNALIGLSYSQTWGKDKYKDAGHTDIDNYVIALYSDICLGQKGPGKLGLSLYAGYGMSRYDAKVPGSNAKWNGDNYLTAFKFNYHYIVSENTVVTPYVGMLWQFGRADSCTSDSNILFGKQDMSVLQMNIGVLTQHRINDKWGISGNLGINPDLYRRNPKGTAILNGVVIDTDCMNPGRVSMNVDVGTYYRITPQWTLNASYGLDFASHATQQTMQVGVSYAF